MSQPYVMTTVTNGTTIPSSTWYTTPTSTTPPPVGRIVIQDSNGDIVLDAEDFRRLLDMQNFMLYLIATDEKVAAYFKAFNTAKTILGK